MSPSFLFPRELAPLTFQARRHQANIARVRRSVHAPSGVVVVFSFLAFSQAAAFARAICAAHRVIVRRATGFHDVVVPVSPQLLGLLHGAEQTDWQSIETF